MNGRFHAGELELQRRAGSADMARAVAKGIRPELPAGAARFLAEQRFAVLSTSDGEGRVWASAVFGPPGFLQVVDERTLRLAAQPTPGDPLAENLAAGSRLGILVIDLRTRRRLRFNGRGALTREGVSLRVEQAYANCPKYITRRALASAHAPSAPGAPRAARWLDARQKASIGAADTFFLASLHPEGGADASHRGGSPGFVRVTDPGRLEFDDYPGNGMFNTLGNLLANPRAGLLFLDFERGDTLQLTGLADVGAGLEVRFSVESVIDTPRASPLRFRLLGDSPASPESSRPATLGIEKGRPGDPAGGER